MRENKQNILKELKELEETYDSNYWRSLRLSRRCYIQCIHFFDQFLNKNISVIGSSDDIEIKDGNLNLKNHNVLNYYNVSQIANFNYDSLGDFVVDCNTFRFINTENCDDYLHKTELIRNFVTFINVYKNTLTENFLSNNLKYNNLIEKLELKSMNKRIEELSKLLVQMEEDLLLEKGNVYQHIKPNGSILTGNPYKIDCVCMWKLDNPVESEYVLFETETESGMSQTPIKKDDFLKMIRNKQLVPDTVTKRKIKLKRLLYES